MERRVTSHTEEEEMNQRRRLLTLARKGDQKSIELLFELYQVKVFSGDALKKKKLPSFPVVKPPNGSGKGGSKASKSKGKASKVSPPDSKPSKGESEKIIPPSKGRPKEKSKVETAKSLSKKSSPSLPSKKIDAKKASLSKKKSPEKETKLGKPSAAKKSRIAKKK